MSTTPSPAGAIAVRAAEEILGLVGLEGHDQEECLLLAAIIQRAISEANAAQWQSIETAPKDGTPVLLHAGVFTHWMPMPAPPATGTTGTKETT